jgi:hypothetical protein
MNCTSSYYDISGEEVRRIEWKRTKKNTKNKIKYVFNKYKRWIKLENKKEIYNLFVKLL